MPCCRIRRRIVNEQKEKPLRQRQRVAVKVKRRRLPEDDPVKSGRKKKWDYAIPRRAFARLAREVGEQYMNVRFTPGSMAALQEAAEQHVVRTIHTSDAVKAQMQGKTLSAPDVELVRRIRGD